MKAAIKDYFIGVLNSYSQIFFSDNKIFSVMLLLVSFADIYTGMAGLLSVIITNLAGILMGFDQRLIRKGVYGFNSLLVGLCIGIFFSPGLILLVVVILASVMTLFIAISLQGVIGKYGLPYLSIPFLLGAWTVTLATRNMEFLGISERGIFTLNELYTIGGQPIITIYEWWNSLEIIRPLKIYFISLGAILFQYNVLSGIIISAGLLYYSRISFSLSILGFFTAYFFYKFVGADISEMNYSYIGFNYILTSVAIGGFFLVPSYRTYLWAILIVPIVALLTLSLSMVFIQIGLPLFALPFNLVVLLFLYALKFRVKPHIKLSEVLIQQNSPEKNLYSFENEIERFRHDMIPVKLPFFGVWTVSQGYDGIHTHKGEWKHALDFIIYDNSGKQFSGKGDMPEEYFCFNKPVLSPADGYIETVIDNIDDNRIGSVNVKNNWGNTVVIRHTNYLFSSLNHLKKSSVTVKTGDRVRQGDIIGRCGNSGRSPYPHLHFQMQSSPLIGSKTLSYPISYFIDHKEPGFELFNFVTPSEGLKISNIDKNELLSNGFDFVPGRTLCFEAVLDKKNVSETWVVNANEYNRLYLEGVSGAKAWFSNDGDLFLFSHYEGSKNTLLYYFFLAAFRVQFGFYKNIEVADSYPLNLTMKKSLLFLQDFAAPFFKFLKSEYNVKYDYVDNEVVASKIRLLSRATNYFLGKVIEEFSFALEIDENGISCIDISKGGVNITSLKCKKQ
ncbi:MAG TPA: urea transporter [Bacteroidales bacterium]|nr:urea transporter [Bacteroidales bacterium]